MFLDIIFKQKENYLKLISDTTGRSLIIYRNWFLHKNEFFPHIRNFSLFYGPYRYLICVLFGPILMKNFVSFFKCLLNFRAHAMQSELEIFWYTYFVKFRLQSMSSRIERVFEKTNKPCFCLHFLEKFNFPWNQLDTIIFCLFHSHDPKQKRIIK